MDATDNPRIVIAGGGVAALEACLALRDRLSAADLDITLLTPAERFDYRPLSVLEPFVGVSRWSLSLATFAADQDITVIHDALTAVGPHARVAVTGAGEEVPYDMLLLATGGHAADALHGALTFRGAGQGEPIRALLDSRAAEHRLRRPARRHVAHSHLRAGPAERRRAAAARRGHRGPARDPRRGAAGALRSGARASSPRASCRAAASTWSPPPAPWRSATDGSS